EGDTYTSAGSFTDPGTDAWTATVDYGDGSGVQSLALNPDKTFSLSHVYADEGSYAVTVSVDDDDGGSDSTSATITVLSVPPMVQPLADVSLNEGDTYSATGSFTDPGADTWTASVDYGDGAGVQPLTLNPDKSFNLNHVYDDNGRYSVTVTVSDD